jgi:hypothetical protein
VDLSTPEGRRKQGELIETALRQAGYDSRTGMARALGVAAETLKAWIYGRNPCSQKYLLLIARLAGKPIAYFFPGPEEQDERARRVNEAYLYVWRLRFRGVSYNSHHSPPTDPADIQGLAARLDYVRLYEKAEGVRLLPDDI